jgi:hypothetical protein
MNRRTWWGTVVLAAFLALAAVPVSAGLMPNGLMPNGLMPNGLMPNGLMPNGLMPNGLMPNGLMPNGLMPNGLMPNGLMPNGLLANGLMPNGLVSYAIYGGMYAANATTSTSFDQWFATDPAARDNFMKYFARCAYDGTMEVTYVDPSKKSWRWSGGIGFAMTSLKAGKRMTPDEGRWISSCLLTFINTQGTHQYLSVRGTPPNKEAAAALKPGINEQWIMGERFGAFFGDLQDAAPKKYACTQRNYLDDYFHKTSVVIGRSCDVENCKYTDANGASQPLLTAHLGSCWLADALPQGSQFLHWRWTFGGLDPYYPYAESGVTYDPSKTLLHPLYVSGPVMESASAVASFTTVDPTSPGSYRGDQAAAYSADVARCAPNSQVVNDPSTCTAADAGFTVPILSGTNHEVCGDVYKCLGSPPTGPDGNLANESYKFVNLRPGQAFDIGVRFTPAELALNLGSQSTLVPDMSEAFTAIIRYSKARTGAANLWVSNKDGSWRNATPLAGGPGPDVWPATGADTWDWMQVYPAYLNFDKQGSATPGRYCSDTSQCFTGFGLKCTNFLCTKPVAIVNTMPWCDDLRVLKQIGSSCFQMCYADNECGRGSICTAGQCVAPAVKVRISGATSGTSCTGAKQLRGDGELNTCSSYVYDSAKSRYTCVKRSEGLPRCRGALVYSTKGWRCVDGGPALFACTSADAPDLDAVGFVPGKPWCMAAGATSFVGACK